MKHTSTFVIFFCFLTLAASASASIIADSSSFTVNLNDGAYITDSAQPSNLFNNELLTLGNETQTGTVAFSDIPYFDFSSTLYFQFVYDMQETGGNRRISIDDLLLSVNNSNFWDYDDTVYGSIVLNDTSPYTSTPLGAGGDMELYVPVSLFSGQGFTGSDILTIAVTQSDSDNGTDEWVVLGASSGGSFFAPGEAVSDTPGSVPVPVPGAVTLFGSGLLLVGVFKKKSTPGS